MRKHFPTKTSEYKKIIGDNIKKAREKKGWNGFGLGKELGITKAAVSQLENGETNLSLSCLQYIAELLDTDISDLIQSKTTLTTESEYATIKQNVLMDMDKLSGLFTEVEDLKLQIKKLSPPPER